MNRSDFQIKSNSLLRAQPTTKSRIRAVAMRCAYNVEVFLVLENVIQEGYDEEMAVSDQSDRDNVNCVLGTLVTGYSCRRQLESEILKV